MHCRECGNLVSDKAEICPSCGVRPLNSNKYCQSCGTKTKAEQELCVECGTKLKTVKSSAAGEDKPSGLVNFAACCFPLLGLILYFVWKGEKPQSAKAVCQWAVIGFVAGLILYIGGMILGAISESMYYY